MADLETLPDASTDFVLTFHLGGSVWLWVTIGIVVVLSVIAILLYRRRQ